MNVGCGRKSGTKVFILLKKVIRKQDRYPGHHSFLYEWESIHIYI